MDNHKENGRVIEQKNRDMLKTIQKNDIELN